MDSLIKAKEALVAKRNQCLDVIKAEIAANPVLKKAYADLESFNKALGIADTHIQKAEDEKKEKEAAAQKEKEEKDLKTAVDEVVKLIDEGNIDDDSFAEIAEKFSLEEDKLKEAVDKYLDED